MAIIEYMTEMYAAIAVSQIQVRPFHFDMSMNNNEQTKQRIANG